MHTELKLTMKSRNTISPSKGPSHHNLIPFAGHWKIQGKNASGEPVTGEEIFEWMDGDFFMVNRFNRKTINETFKGLGWIAFDNATGAYLSYSISNTGFLRLYEVEMTESQMNLIGENERAVFKLNAEQNTISIVWEKSSDGEIWELICASTGRRMT